MSKVLAVGDIHTKQWIIDTVESLSDSYDKVVFVGDYVDDWGKPAGESIATWKKLKALNESNPEKFLMVMGNHDYLYAHKNKSRMASGWDSMTQLILGTDVELAMWVRGLPISVEVDGITFSHAGYLESWVDGDDLWNEDSPIWVRPNIIPYGGVYKDNQVFGHTPSKECWQVPSGENVWCIDTFSTHRDGTPIGDQTVLKIVDGKEFTPIKLI